MAKRSWDKDRERGQMRNAEQAFPSDKDEAGRAERGTFRPPPAPLPAWMRDRAILPKKPPTKPDVEG